MDITRRDGLGMLAGLAAAGATANAQARSILRPTGADGSLQSLAAAKGMRLGSCFAWSEPGADRGSFANQPMRDC